MPLAPYSMLKERTKSSRKGTQRIIDIDSSSSEQMQHYENIFSKLFYNTLTDQKHSFRIDGRTSITFGFPELNRYTVNPMKSSHERMVASDEQVRNISQNEYY